MQSRRKRKREGGEVSVAVKFCFCHETLNYTDYSEPFEPSSKQSKLFQMRSKCLKDCIYSRGTVRTIAIALLAGAAIITSDHIIDGYEGFVSLAIVPA